MSNYPPGVTGNEPQITGEWPCVLCGGEAAERNEDGGWDRCPHCRGAGIEPEEFDLGYVQACAKDGCSPEVAESIVEAVRCCVFDRAKPDDRAMLRAVARIKREHR